MEIPFYINNHQTLFQFARFPLPTVFAYTNKYSFLKYLCLQQLLATPHNFDRSYICAYTTCSGLCFANDFLYCTYYTILLFSSQSLLTELSFSNNCYTKEQDKQTLSLDLFQKVASLPNNFQKLRSQTKAQQYCFTSFKNPQFHLQ